MLENTKISSKLAENVDKLMVELGFSGKKILFVSDQKIWQNCQSFFVRDFSDKFILENAQADEENLEKILQAAKNFDAILALGSGTINDLCKLSAARLKIPYAIFASAPSMNGYLSKNASIKINGHKKTILATLPQMVFCDLEILQAAPQELIKAGIGDVMCFYSCWFDWYLSHLIFKTKFNPQPFEILSEKMSFLVENYQKFSLTDKSFLNLLIEILLLSGHGMTIAGGSYPASESEHLIAHALEMKYADKMAKILHGNQIATTTFTSLQIQKKIIENELSFGNFSFPKQEMIDFFGEKIAFECEKEYQEKVVLMSHLIAPKLAFEEKEQLQKILFSAEKLQKIFDHFVIDYSIENLGISENEYRKIVQFAKYIRNRFTCLDFLDLKG